MTKADRRKARNAIARMSESKDLTQCMARLEGCMGEAHAPAHRKKVRHYKTWQEYADLREWMPMCQQCHHETEYNRRLNEEVFEKWNLYIGEYYANN